MLKTFFKHGLVYSASIFLSRGLSIILLPFYTRVLTPNDYGIIDIMTITTTLVSYIITLEIAQAIARFYHETNESNGRIEYSSTAFWFTIFMYTLFLIMALVFSNPFSILLLDTSELSSLFRVTLFYIWWNGIFYFLQNQLRWSIQPKKNALINILDSSFSIAITILLVLVFRMGVIGVFYGLLSGKIVAGVLAFIYTKSDFQFVFKWNKLKEMLYFSVPLVPSSVGVFANLYISRIAIKELMSLTEVGIYGIGYRVATCVGLLLTGFQGALTPLIYATYKDEKIKTEIARLFHYFIAGALMIFLTLSIFAKEILIVFTTPRYYEAEKVIPYLVISVLVFGSYIFFPGLAIAKKTRRIAFINILAGVINTVLNFVLIPIIGIIGAALATLISSFTVAVLYFMWGQKSYFIPFKWFNIALAIGTTVSILIFCSLFNINNLFIMLFIKVLLVLICMGLVTYQLIERNDLKKILFFIKVKLIPIFNK